MGFFDKITKKGRGSAPECEPLTVYVPAEGTVLPLEQFPDELFSQEVLGPGCGLVPSGNKVFAPFNGTVTQVTDTMHAIGVTSDDGVELLIHVGVDTVDMGGKGFRCTAKVGQKIAMGDELLQFDRDEIQAAGHPDAIAVIVTNSDEFSGLTLQAEGTVTVGESLLKAEK